MATRRKFDIELQYIWSEGDYAIIGNETTLMVCEVDKLDAVYTNDQM